MPIIDEGSESLCMEAILSFLLVCSFYSPKFLCSVLFSVVDTCSRLGQLKESIPLVTATSSGIYPILNWPNEGHPMDFSWN